MSVEYRHSEKPQHTGYLLSVKWTSCFFFALTGMSLQQMALANEAELRPTEPEKTTTIYKVVNPDGSVSFSDQPESRSEALQVAPVPTIPALKPQEINQANQGSRAPEKPETVYQIFNITAPADQSAFNSGSGDVTVMLELSPPLSNGDMIELYLDNKLIKRGQQTQFVIPAVDRGSHNLQARITTSTGEVLEETSSSFTVHRPSIKR